MAENSLRDQAISILQRYKGSYFTRLGQMVGRFAQLAFTGTKLYESLASSAKELFEALTDAQKDLLTGGISAEPLPYDTVKSLLNILAKISGQRLILVLDAWEKAGSIRRDPRRLRNF
jgi:hypothetical protein